MIVLQGKSSKSFEPSTKASCVLVHYQMKKLFQRFLMVEHEAINNLNGSKGTFFLFIIRISFGAEFIWSHENWTQQMSVHKK